MSTTFNYYDVTLEQMTACVPGAVVERLEDMAGDPQYRVVWPSVEDGVQIGVEIWFTAKQIRVDKACGLARNGQSEFTDLLSRHGLDYTYND